MNILYITPYVPSRIFTRPYHLIRALVRLGHRLSLLTASRASAEEREQADELRGWGIRVEVFPVPLWRSLSNCLRALPSREPLQAVYAYHPRLEQRLAQLSREGDYDLVHIEHLRAARLVAALRRAAVPELLTVYDSVDSISLLFEQAARTSPLWRSRLMAMMDLARTRRYEARLMTQYDQVVVTSQRDKEALEELACRYLPPETRIAPITVVTNGVDLEYFDLSETAGQRDDRTVVFTGKMSYHANVAAALYFAQEVLPYIWAHDAEVKFQIVGKDPPEAVQQLATDRRIQVTGYVDDLRPYLARARVAVCPVRYAVGIQNKVLEAMAMGTPVVTTSAGCTALAVTTGRELLIADGEENLADAILRITSDPALAKQLSVSGRRYVETHHSWDASARRLAEIYSIGRGGASVPTLARPEADAR